jgi:hypothetical protein
VRKLRACFSVAVAAVTVSAAAQNFRAPDGKIAVAVVGNPWTGSRSGNEVSDRSPERFGGCKRASKGAHLTLAAIALHQRHEIVSSLTGLGAPAANFSVDSRSRLELCRPCGTSVNCKSGAASLRCAPSKVVVSDGARYNDDIKRCVRRPGTAGGSSASAEPSSAPAGCFF